MTSQVTAGNGLQSPPLQIIEFTGAGGYNNDGSSFPAFTRDDDAPDNGFDGVSFRSVLYVKL